MATSDTEVLDTLVREPDETRDEHGNHVIRHSGPDAHVVSHIDPKGRLLRQELVLGRNAIIWSHGTRVRTGLLPWGQHDAPNALFDREPSHTRLEHARLAVQHYSGSDQILRHLVRALQSSTGLALAGAEVVAHFGTPARPRATLVGTGRRRAQVLALAAFVTFVLLYLFGRR